MTTQLKIGATKKKKNKVKRKCISNELASKISVTMQTRTKVLLHTSAQQENDKNSTDRIKLDFVCLIATDAQKPTTNSGWIIGSGATAHMTYDSHMFKSFVSNKSSNVNIENDQKLKCLAEGTVQLDLTVDGKNCKCKLNNVAYVPGLRYHLMYVSATCEAECQVVVVKLTFFDL